MVTQHTMNAQANFADCWVRPALSAAEESDLDVGILHSTTTAVPHAVTISMLPDSPSTS